uniref:Predicted WD40 repeat protein n=1 Tax=Trypanosoma congolense (strain IL3000) TaxID=1068625 RepID=G0UZ41_TRYCI|nr:predicted WD40 repeat protein [Trypanosoma congolense IL3000]
MEGRNCFRTRWSQVPLYSGGNIASLLLPAHGSTSSGDGVECLVTACGDTVNVLRASTGELLVSYTLPVEDVILRIDAVSVLPKRKHLAVTAGDGGGGSQSRSRKTKRSAHAEVNSKSEDAAASAAAAAPPTGCYIAVGTRSLQLYVLRLECKHVRPSEADAKIEKEVGDVSRRSPSKDTSDVKTASVGFTLSTLRSWTAAQQAISVVQFTFDGSHLVSGSTDGGVKVWDVFQHYLTHNLRTPSSSVVHSFYVDPKQKFICVGSFEGHVAVFDFVVKTLLAHVRPHVAAVEALCVTPDGEHLFSIGRDRKVVISKMGSSGLQELRSIAVKEHVSCALFESPSLLHVGAMNHTVATYDVSVTEALRLTRRQRHIASGSGEADEELTIRSLLIAKKPKGTYEVDFLHGIVKEESGSQLYAADASFNISLLVPHPSAAAYVTDVTLVGFLDQVLDVKLFSQGLPFHRVVVTNSKDLRCYSSPGCLSSVTLSGHNDIVLTCAISSDDRLIATAGKDKDVLFWSTTTWSAVAIGRGGHEAEVTSIVFNAKQSDSYLLLFSVGADESVRVWDVGAQVLPVLVNSGIDVPQDAAPAVFSYRAGINSAHEGAIHTVAVAPNDQYVATAGKDKNVNLWTISGKKIFRDASLKGHRRAISSLAFSPADRVLASASNDGSVRLWSLVSLTCVKTLQTDRIAVLQLSFFNNGTQLVTGNAEGVLRVWAIAAAETVWSGEIHEDKIWALSVSEGSDGSVVFFSGSADGVLVALEDYTAEEAQRVREERRDIILKEQELANALRKGEFVEAFLLALKLNHPRNLRQVVLQWSIKEPHGCEEALCHTVLPKLDEEQLVRLLQFTREWITNARHCGVASLVTHAILRAFHFSVLAEMPAISNVLEALLAYTRRHSHRVHDLLRRTYYLDYVTRSLGPPTLTSNPPFVHGTPSMEEAPGKMRRVERG